MPASAQGLLLEAFADQVELGSGHERVHHRDRIRDDRGGGGLVANPSMAMTSTDWANSAGSAPSHDASVVAERPGTKIQQPRWAGLIVGRREVCDQCDEPGRPEASGCPVVLIDADHRYPSQAIRARRG